MTHILKFLFLPLLFVYTCSFAQKNKSPKPNKADRLLVTNLQAHISYLADDKLEGRRAGTNGEKLAMEYISSQFQKTGIEPRGSNGFYQPFSIYDGKQMDPSTHFIINDNHLVLGKDFFPLSFSSNISLEALPAIALQETDMPWFYDLKTGLEENKNNPHFDLYDYIRNNVKKAKERGASAIILYNSSSIDDQLQFNSKDRSEVSDIPVLYVSKEVAGKYFADETATLDIKLKVVIGDKFRTGNNVIGYIDNGATATVVLGAHFDHLGYGEDGNSMIRTGEKLIHNGADDNASG
ncbi:MAG TPA: M28 family peptidase, partial [Chitinophagaceae bacterium]|nr:M28 family peptidase [Chitinophagaceae bacterium]